MEGLSTLVPYGYQTGDCGYCKQPGSSQKTRSSRASRCVSSSSEQNTVLIPFVAH